MPRKRTAKKRTASRTKRNTALQRQDAPRRADRKKLPETELVDGKKDKSCPIVGIGGSAGGYEAACELLKHLPPRTGMAFVVVQHLDPHHASNLPKLLGKITQLPVIEIGGRVKPEPDIVYVLPSNKGLLYKNGALILTRRIERPTLAIDRFFESLAEEEGARAIGVLLSGSGSDGTAGLRAIKAAGGITFAQDEESAKFPTMPRNAIQGGFVDAALSPKQIADELDRIAGHPYVQKLPPAAEEPQADHADLDDL